MTDNVWEDSQLVVTRFSRGFDRGIGYQFTPRDAYASLTRENLISLVKTLIIELGQEALPRTGYKEKTYIGRY